MTETHPLLKAIEMQEKAVRQMAHPKFIRRLDLRVEEEAAKTREKLSGPGAYHLPVLDMLRDGEKFDV